MKLFNLEGSAIFGSGSEWFWSMLQFLVVAATLIGLYRQVRLQSSQTAVSQLSSLEVEWFSEPSTHYKLAVLTALRDGVDPANLPRAAAQAIARMWEKIGILAHQGHLDHRLLWNSLGTACGWWWATLDPFARRVRSEMSDPLVLEHFEWLAGLMTEMDNSAGIPIKYEPFSGVVLAAQIADCEERLRVDQAVRTVIAVRSR